MLSDKKCSQKMIKMYEEHHKLRRVPVSGRSTKAHINKLEAMTERLETTFPLWPQDVEILIRNEEDLKFLVSMKGGRLASFGSCDTMLASKRQRSAA